MLAFITTNNQKTVPGHPVENIEQEQGHLDSFGKVYFLLSLLLLFQVRFYMQVKFYLV